MSPFLQFINTLLDPNHLDGTINSAINGGVSLLFYAGFILYILFAFVAVRQIEEMRKTIVTPLSPIVQILGYAHLLFSVLVLVFVSQYLH